MSTDRVVKNALVVDVGGTHLKLADANHPEPVKIVSGLTMTARRMITVVRKTSADWKYDAVSIGFPGPVLQNQPMAEPHNCGGGWVAFNFKEAFGCPVKIVNDAAMQA